MSDQPKRLIIRDPRSKNAAGIVARVSDVSSMLNGALKTLAEQLDKLALKSRAATFDEKEARVLQGYIKSLVELSKEDREREKADTLGELANMSNEELLELAKSKLIQAKNSANE
jgi:hypothetical protein